MSQIKGKEKRNNFSIIEKLNILKYLDNEGAILPVIAKKERNVLYCPHPVLY